MRLQELFEDMYAPNRIDYESTEDLVDKVVGYIEDNCRPWLEASGGMLVYRGATVTNPVWAYTRKVRQDRLPMNSSEEMHDLFNGLIAMAGGVANRDNSVFVTSDPGEARMYGDVHVVLPVGPFNYTWSPHWSDWYSDLRTEGGKHDLRSLLRQSVRLAAGPRIRGEDSGLLDPGNYDPVQVQRFIYADRELPRAIKSGHEIMISCNTVLYLDPAFYKANISKYL